MGEIGMNGKIGILVDLELCVGCYACQSACNSHNHLPLGESYLKCIVDKPELVDGKLKMFLCPVPLSLEHCTECVKELEVAPCAPICIGGAMDVGPVDRLMFKASENDRHSCLFQ